MTTTLQKDKGALIPILLTCVAYCYYNISDAGIKMMAAKYHFSEVIFFQCVFIILFMFSYGLWKQGRGVFRMNKPRLVLARAALSIFVSVLNVLAFPHIELTTFYTLVFTSPFWVAILSSWFLGEKLNRSQMAVIMAGFAVILFVFRPGSAHMNIYALMVLCGAFLYSCSMVIMRKMGPAENRTMIICMGSFLSALFNGAIMLYGHHFVMPIAYDFGVYGVMGLLSAIGISCIAWAFQNAPSAAVVAPYHYTQIVWGTLIGYYMFDETPETRVIMGAALIIAAGLYLIYMEVQGKTKFRPPEYAESVG